MNPQVSYMKDLFVLFVGQFSNLDFSNIVDYIFQLWGIISVKRNI